MHIIQEKILIVVQILVVDTGLVTLSLFLNPLLKCHLAWIVSRSRRSCNDE